MEIKRNLLGLPKTNLGVTSPKNKTNEIKVKPAIAANNSNSNSIRRTTYQALAGKIIF